MANEVYCEKVSVNINTSTLSNIDILVDNGYYSNRSDFINQAVREALQKHQTTLDRIIEKNMSKADKENHWFIGISGFTAKEIEQMHRNGESISMRGYGMLIIDEKCPEDMLFSVVTEIHVRGKVVCSPAVKAHYGLK